MGVRQAGRLRPHLLPPPARQSGDSFAPWPSPYDPAYTMYDIRDGNLSAADMVLEGWPPDHLVPLYGIIPSPVIVHYHMHIAYSRVL